MDREFNPELFRPPPRPVSEDLVMARTLYERLTSNIEKAHEALGEDEMLGVYYHGQGLTPILVTDIGYHNPFFIRLYGVDTQTGEDCTVLVHTTSLQIVMKVHKQREETPRRPIGFLGSSTLNEEASGGEGAGPTGG